MTHTTDNPPPVTTIHKSKPVWSCRDGMRQNVDAQEVALQGNHIKFQMCPKPTHVQMVKLWPFQQEMQWSHMHRRGGREHWHCLTSTDSLKRSDWSGAPCTPRAHSVTFITFNFISVWHARPSHYAPCIQRTRVGREKLETIANK